MLNIIYDPVQDPDMLFESKAPRLPIVIKTKTGLTAETDSTREAVSLLIDNYLNLANESDCWKERVFIAREAARDLLRVGIDAMPFDHRKGFIPFNLLTSDEEYYPTVSINELEKIKVETDHSFLLTLAKLDWITLLEREDSYIFRKHNLHDNYINRTKEQKCSNCLYFKSEEKEFICNKFNFKSPIENEKINGICCSGFVDQDLVKESGTTNYIDIGALMNLEGDQVVNWQEWLWGKVAKEAYNRKKINVGVGKKS